MIYVKLEDSIMHVTVRLPFDVLVTKTSVNASNHFAAKYALIIYLVAILLFLVYA